VSQIQPGKTYVFQPGPDSTQQADHGRKAIALEPLSPDSEIWKIRWASGFETVASSQALQGPVEPLKPGIDEPCLICGGSKEVEETRPNKDKPWLREMVGKRACPNCGEDSGR